MRATRHTSAQLLLAMVLTAPTAAPSAAGVLEDALRDTRDGRLTFSYPVRDGVYGNGHGVYTVGGAEGEGWIERCDCTAGPAHVLLRVRDGEVVDLDLRVGGTLRPGRAEVTSVGTVGAGEAAAFLLTLAETATDDDVDEAVLAASVAEGFDAWDRVLHLARDRSRPESIREAAIFWLGQAASREATRGLTAIVDDDDEELSVREHAIFALSQRDTDECIATLEHVARTSPHPQLREKALFWLAQHDDPRVLDLFEEILASGR